MKPVSPSFTLGAEVIRAQLKTMPNSAGVYRMLNAVGDVLYVGKAKNLPRRVTSYTQPARLPQRLLRMVAQTRSMDVVVTHTEVEALLLEANMIRRLKPPFNILLRDDKSFPYIMLTTDHDFPALLKHRGPRRKGATYFGPFASAKAVNETLTLLQRGFMLRNCSDAMFNSRRRPCLQYHIKRCTAPCVGRVDAKAYAAQVAQGRAFLSGKDSQIQRELATQMQTASDHQDYEKAAQLRDRIKALTTVQSRQNINMAGMGDADVIALHRDAGQAAVQVFFFRQDRNFGNRGYLLPAEAETSNAALMAAFLSQFYAAHPPPPLLLLSDLPDDIKLLAAALGQTHKVQISVPRQGVKARALAQALENARADLTRRMTEQASLQTILDRLATLFQLPAPPQRIEIYDNSHIQGSYAVGGMVVATPDGFDKKSYRKFTIRTAGASNDDFAMMEEVFTRRFRRLVDEDPGRQRPNWPDLVLIDGGVGQLERARRVLMAMGLDDLALVGIAKGPDRNAGRERFFLPNHPPFDLPPDDPALYFLQRLRDEAHRYAIGAHRQKRAKAITTTPLDDIAGIGPTRKRALLNHFGSARAVAGAGIADLTQVTGISQAVAHKIYAHFHDR